MYVKRSLIFIIIFDFILDLPDRRIVAEYYNPAVPCCVLEEISGWLYHGATLEDAIDRLRLRTVPSGYKIHTWQPGE